MTKQDHKNIVALCNRADKAEKLRNHRRCREPSLWVVGDAGYEWPWSNGFGAGPYDPFLVLELTEIAEYEAIEAEADCYIAEDKEEAEKEFNRKRKLADRLMAAATACFKPYAKTIKRMKF